MEANNDIDGLELTVTANGSNGEGGIKLVEDEWYSAILSEFKPYDNSYQGKITKSLRWFFELQGEQFTWKSKSGKTGQFKTSLSTSLACSPKSKLYKYYSKLIGKEPAEGEKIKLKDLLGMNCFIMVKITKDKNDENKVWYNVDKVKPGVGKVEVKKEELKSVIQEPPKEEIKEGEKPGEDIFKDIF
jgi:predicted 3-demethylubiquinone-9 3-methyltransferase (glyoxalase superfamily)